ncbi:hypothetical protein [Bradyrhizobium sp. Ash2021]|uniref:hypothetical protein n=1 Tax=Bradyrhizobium sp. Ash2021 TaxID=2954771 RepID=UPI0028166CF6|nr:hypothetical protein [Bradyrhizobium sp. Ash2021]WMT71334.1 hypothetical protein NL528_24895 [Bradyrhizobium sp. Ash2021]
MRDLASAWQQHGIQALDDCATKEPATFCKIIASLLPRHVDLNLSSVDVSEFAQRFATAIELLGNAEAPIPRRPLKVINGR